MSWAVSSFGGSELGDFRVLALRFGSLLGFASWGLGFRV